MTVVREVLAKVAQAVSDGYSEALLRVALIVGAVLIVRGVEQVNESAAYIVGGLLVAGLAVLFFAEDA